MNIYPRSRSSDLLVQSTNNEVLVYDLLIDKAYLLNQTSAFIWHNLDGKTSIKDISLKLAKHFQEPANEEIVWLAIDLFKRENLLENNQSVNLPFTNTTRREVIKKAGLATMIALPLVSSLIAPTSAHAASGCLSCYPAGAVPTQCLPPHLLIVNTIDCIDYCRSICCSDRFSDSSIDHFADNICKCLRIGCA